MPETIFLPPIIIWKDQKPWQTLWGIFPLCPWWKKQWALVHKEEGKYEEALEHFETHKRLEDSTKRSQQDMFMMSQKVQRDLFEREKTLAEQEKSLALLEEKILLENRWQMDARRSGNIILSDRISFLSEV